MPCCGRFRAIYEVERRHIYLLWISKVNANNMIYLYTLPLQKSSPHSSHDITLDSIIPALFLVFLIIGSSSNFLFSWALVLFLSLANSTNLKIQIILTIMIKYFFSQINIFNWSYYSKNILTGTGNVQYY